MSASPSKPKQTSRWGSLLQGAVAGIESRLDTILAEDAAPGRNARTADPAKSVPSNRREAQAPRLDNVKNEEPSRSPPRNQKPERPLQRYSKNVADTEARQRPSSRASDRSLSRAETPDLGDQPVAAVKPSRKEEADDTKPNPADAGGADVAPQKSEEVLGLEHTTDADPDESRDVGLQDSSSEQDLLNPSITEDAKESMSRTDISSNVAANSQVEVPQSGILRDPDHSTSQSEQTEEVHALLERIDALQAKLQYLAKAATESSRRAALEAPQGSIEKSLADKDTQIALLLQEGEQLSRSEVNQTTLIKRLRRKAADDDRAIAEVRRLLRKTESSLSSSNDELTRVKAVQKGTNEKLFRLSRLEKDVESLRAEVENRDSTIATLRRQLEDAVRNADKEASLANIEAQAVEKKIVSELRDDLTNARNEIMALEEKTKIDNRNAEAELRREKERNQANETSLRNEMSLMESKLELLRARTEEVSSGTMGDTHAKLMRQIETLQTQYAVASENWHGIEGSMQSRIADLEKEKDEAQRQEFETRRKARDANTRSRRLQEEVDEASRQCRALEKEREERRAATQKLESRVLEIEKALQNDKSKFAKEKQTWEVNLQSRIEEEKLKWRQEAASQTALRTTSPLGARKMQSVEIPNFPAKRITSRNVSIEPIAPIADILERPASRRSSNLMPRVPEALSPNGVPSDINSAQWNGSRSGTPSVSGNAPETPSIQTMDYEDPLDRGSSPQRTVNDMISGSTANTGPSVQLVERMSAAVRRLESEKAVSKDEISRLSSQRDDARQEVVSLMREVEQKREADKKSSKLEAELADVTRRYQTTLEMLGEKSEQVDELRADVDDLKKIYKDLVERSLK